MRGNVMDLAVGVIIGAAFGKIVTSLVEDVLMPPIGQLVGKVDFSGLFFSLSGKSYDTLKAAKEAGVAKPKISNFLRNAIKIFFGPLPGFLFWHLYQLLSRKTPPPHVL